jgi:nucleoside 2-deoxyribosyltransferase
MQTQPSKRIFLFQPFFEEFDAARNAIRAAGSAVGAEVHRLDEVMEAGSITERAYEEIEAADLIVCDITTANSNVMYRLGYAHALR